MRPASKFAVLVAALALLVAPASHADDLSPQAVGVDGVGDHPLLQADVPPYWDIVTILIGETDNFNGAEDTPDNPDDDTIGFTIQYADMLDGVTAAQWPAVHNFWPLVIDVDGFEIEPADPTADDIAFEVSFQSPLAGQRGYGALASSCTLTVNVWECEEDEDAVVTVVVDEATHSVTAHVRRIDLKDQDGNVVAVTGATLVEADIFVGVASCQGVGLISAAMCDEADFTVGEGAAYILGSGPA